MRPRRKIEFERFMGKKAWTAEELSVRIGVHVAVCRRYLRLYYNIGRLDKVKFGRYWYFAVARFLQPADGFYPCPLCNARMEVFHTKCGCTFQICLMDESHSRFDYCERHRGGERSL